MMLYNESAEKYTRRMEELLIGSNPLDFKVVKFKNGTFAVRYTYYERLSRLYGAAPENIEEEVAVFLIPGDVKRHYCLSSKEEYLKDGPTYYSAVNAKLMLDKFLEYRELIERKKNINSENINDMGEVWGE